MDVTFYEVECEEFDLNKLNRVKKYVMIFSYTEIISLAKRCDMSLTGDHL